MHELTLEYSESSNLYYICKLWTPFRKKIYILERKIEIEVERSSNKGKVGIVACLFGSTGFILCFFTNNANQYFAVLPNKQKRVSCWTYVYLDRGEAKLSCLKVTSSFYSQDKSQLSNNEDIYFIFLFLYLFMFWIVIIEIEPQKLK